MTTIHISEETHKELRKIKGKLMVSNGKERSFDEIISEIVNFWKEWQQVISDHLGLIDMTKRKHEMPDSPSALGLIITEHSGVFKERE